MAVSVYLGFRDVYGAEPHPIPATQLTFGSTTHDLRALTGLWAGAFWTRGQPDAWDLMVATVRFITCRMSRR